MGKTMALVKVGVTDLALSTKEKTEYEGDRMNGSIFDLLKIGCLRWVLV